MASLSHGRDIMKLKRQLSRQNIHIKQLKHEISYLKCQNKGFERPSLLHGNDKEQATGDTEIIKVENNENIRRKGISNSTFMMENTRGNRCDWVAIEMENVPIDDISGT